MSEKERMIEKLFNKASDNDKSKQVVFDQYKLYVEMADRISQRRVTANSFFLSINTALVALIGYLTNSTSASSLAAFSWIVAPAGLVMCYLWFRIIKAYRGLNTAKFEIIHEIECKLPISPYGAEWEAVGQGKDPKAYLPFTHIEIYVPWVFFALYALTLIFSTGLKDLIVCLIT